MPAGRHVDKRRQQRVEEANAAMPTPMLSTTNVPTKFCMIRAPAAPRNSQSSTSLVRSLPIKTTSALSRATPFPTPWPHHIAFASAGASFTPSPTTATTCDISVSRNYILQISVREAAPPLFHQRPASSPRFPRSSSHFSQKNRFQPHGLERLQPRLLLPVEAYPPQPEFPRMFPRGATKICEWMRRPRCDHATPRSDRNCSLPTALFASQIAECPCGVYSNCSASLYRIPRFVAFRKSLWPQDARNAIRRSPPFFSKSSPEIPSAARTFRTSGVPNRQRTLLSNRMVSTSANFSR